MRDRVNFVYAVMLILAMLASQKGWAQQASFPTDYTIRPDTKLMLAVPYSTILYGEIPYIYVGIQNSSPNPLKLIKSFDFDSWKQMLFEARSKMDGLNLTQPESLPSWERVLTDIEGVEEIREKDYRVFSDILYNYDILPKGTSQIRATLLTGEKEVVVSEWVNLKRLNDQPLEKAEIIATIDFSTFKELPMRKAEIENQSYLFVHRRRIAQIPKGAKLRFGWDKTNQLLTVFFDGVNVPPLVHHVRMIETRKGTPETAPHLAALEALKAQLRETSLETSNQNSTSNVTNQATNSVLSSPSVTGAVNSVPVQRQGSGATK